MAERPPASAAGPPPAGNSRAAADRSGPAPGIPRPTGGNAEQNYHLGRPDTPADWRAYHDIRREVLLESRDHAFEHLDEELQGQGTRRFPLLFWLAERPIGTVRIDCLEGGLAALRLVAIDPPCQCRGHGLRLLRQAELFAYGLGCRVAVVYATSESAGFYARGGYAEETWDDCCVGGIVQMMKALV